MYTFSYYKDIYIQLHREKTDRMFVYIRLKRQKRMKKRENDDFFGVI